MKNIKKEIILIITILVIQTIIYVICGINKSYIHMDEAYSLGLASYDKVEIQDNTDFYNNWHNNKYYEDYLAVEDDEINEYKQVYENQRNDVHPPLYYLVLRIAMGMYRNSYSKWPGIIVNIIIYCFVTIMMYLILKKLLENEENKNIKALIIAFISSITMASLTNVIYIRMYALSTLNILITTYLHMKLFDEEKLKPSLLVGIGVSTLIGSLTHYYYLFFLVMMYLIFVFKYIKQKKYKNAIYYTITMAIAGVTSLIIFPYSIEHMFFGYRGQGAISNLTDISKFITNITLYIEKVNRFGFNGLLYIFVILLIGILVYLKSRKRDIEEIKNKYILILVLPTVFYFILVAISSPWIELRYIMPVCSLIFILIMYYLYSMVKNIVGEKKTNIIVGVMLVIMAVLSPIIFKIEPEVMYSDKKEIVNKLEDKLNLPTLFMFNSSQNRFLDDILLFAKINESYVAKDIDCTIENIKEIFKGIETNNGIIIFINEGQENDELLEVIKQATNLEKWEYLKRLNACDVYYMK